MTRSFGATLFAILSVGAFALAACSSQTKPAAQSPASTATPHATATVQLPPAHPVTPQEFCAAYGVAALIKQGFTGKGQTVVDIVSYGSPTLQADLDTFDNNYGLPPITLQIINPLGTVQFDPNDDTMVGWAAETELDVEIIHAIAPDAGIVVLTSPVAETEGTVGLPEFLQLEQYAIAHHLGSIISQSWGASEATLQDAAGRAEVQKWDAFFQQATAQGITFLAGSGDFGVTDYADLQSTQFATKPTDSFPNDDPWVTAVGGTQVRTDYTHFAETAWQHSGGGYSALFPMPAYQKTLPAGSSTAFNGRRGIPDVAGDADPASGLETYLLNGYHAAGGTSASTPLWAALVAIANQMAGRNLGFINPALYQIAASPNYARDFRDVTVGNNSFSHEDATPVQGFNATPGWDAVTGLGSPNAQYLLPDLIKATQR